jgi:hypothetical protein
MLGGQKRGVRPNPTRPPLCTGLDLERLLAQGIIEPVQFSEWAARSSVIKNDGSVRICGNYKITVSQVATHDKYPLPLIDDLSASAGFTELDLSHLHQQIELDEESRQYVTISIHKGLFRYNSLPFGVASAPSIFQRTMENLLQGIPVSASIYRRYLNHRSHG